MVLTIFSGRHSAVYHKIPTPRADRNVSQGIALRPGYIMIVVSIGLDWGKNPTEWVPVKLGTAVMCL